MKKRPKHFIGPPIQLSNAHILARVQALCIECDHCGEHWHYTGAIRPGAVATVNIMGQIMTARRAVYLASGRKIKRGNRITSKCKNPRCCAPEMLKQATPGEVLQQSYVKGRRDKREAAAHLRSMHIKKVTDEIAERIRNDTRLAKEAAPDYDIHPVYFNRIRRGAARAPRNVFSGLGAR